MPKIFTSKTQKTGEIGEKIAEKFLMKQGHKILDRNYTKKWGEIDIISQKDKKLFFIEVKSISSLSNINILEKDNYRPEDNMHPWKLKRLSRTIQSYILEKNIDENVDWQLDLLVVFLDLDNKKARIKVVSDIIL